ERRGDHLARPTPFRPEIHDHGLVSLKHVGLKIVLVYGDGGHQPLLLSKGLPPCGSRRRQVQAPFCHALVSRARAAAMASCGTGRRRGASVKRSAAETFFSG